MDGPRARVTATSGWVNKFSIDAAQPRCRFVCTLSRRVNGGARDRHLERHLTQQSAALLILLQGFYSRIDERPEQFPAGNYMLHLTLPGYLPPFLPAASYPWTPREGLANGRFHRAGEKLRWKNIARRPFDEISIDDASPRYLV